MTEGTRNVSGAQRAVLAVFRGAGGRSVTVLVPAPAAEGVALEQLGLATPGFVEVELSPVVVRLKSSRTDAKESVWEMLVPGAVASAAAGGGASAVRGFFRDAACVLIDDARLLVGEVSYRDCIGEPFLYRVELQMPLDAEV